MRCNTCDNNIRSNCFSYLLYCKCSNSFLILDLLVMFSVGSSGALTPTAIGLASILSLLALISTLMLSADTGFWVSGVKFPLATSFDPRDLSKIGPNVRRVSSRKSHQKGKKGTIQCKVWHAELPNICIASLKIILHTNRSLVNHFY